MVGITVSVLLIHTPSMPTPLILVCDDAGFASVDRGIRVLTQETGRPVSAEYMIEQDGAAERAQRMEGVSNVLRGLHFEWSGITDEARFRLAKELQRRGTSLGEQPDIRRRAVEDARRQLALFRTMLRTEPAHISTHGNFNADAHGNVMPWWKDLMDELFDGDVPPMQLDLPYVRHNLYSWNVPGTARPPRTPVEFSHELEKFRDRDAVEFVMHPALPQHGDASIDMLFTAEMRERDLLSAIRIIRSGVIERAGFAIVPVSSLADGDHLSREREQFAVAS